MSDVKFKPCPFCGTDLEKYPIVMLIHKAHSEEYLIWLHEHGKFWGSDNEFVVDCPRCGAVGQRGVTKAIAIEQWNTRYSEKPSQINENAAQAVKEQEFDKLYSKAKEQVNFDFTDGVYDLSE